MSNTKLGRWHLWNVKSAC